MGLRFDQRPGKSVDVVNLLKPTRPKLVDVETTAPVTNIVYYSLTEVCSQFPQLTVCFQLSHCLLSIVSLSALDIYAISPCDGFFLIGLVLFTLLVLMGDVNRESKDTARASVRPSISTRTSYF